MPKNYLSFFLKFSLTIYIPIDKRFDFGYTIYSLNDYYQKSDLGLNKQLYEGKMSGRSKPILELPAGQKVLTGAYGCFGYLKILLALILLLLAPAVWAAPQTQNQLSEPMTMEGWLTLIWGDGASGAQPGPVTFWLTTPEGQTIPLLLEESSLTPAQLATLNRRYVTVVGVSRPDQAALAVQTLQAAPQFQTQALAALTGPQPWVSLLCKFSDVPAEPQPRAFFQGMYSSQYPGLDYYWREVSYHNVTLEGSQALGWYTLPHPRSYYVYDRNNDGRVELDHARAVQDCTAVADPDLHFPTYVGINLMFNAELDGYAWGGAYYLSLDGVTKSYRVTWEPPWGYAQLSVLAHEMGHGFGLPHSSGSYGAIYDNRWDVMSDAWSGCSRFSDPVYGCLGQHTIAYHQALLGWIPPERTATVAIGERVTLTLESATHPITNWQPLMVKIPISPTLFYVVEARTLEGYDVKLPGQAVIIHEVNLARSTPAHVVDADNNHETGDAGAMWLPGETFTDLHNRITVAVEAATASGFVVMVQNQGAPMPADLIIQGVAEGTVNQPYDFTAMLNPALQPQEVIQIWQATGYAPITITGRLTSTVTFYWEMPGQQTITVTAITDKGTTQNNHTLFVRREFRLYLPLTLRNVAEPGR